MLKRLVWFTIIVSVFAIVVGGAFLSWGYFYVTRDLPHLESANDYRPPAVTKVFASDGTLVAEFFRERRYPAKLSEVPLHVRNAFLAAEDALFYSHPGINPLSIIRALFKNLQTGAAKQGGSTITQQVVKNLLLTPEKKLVRKAKEAILSYRLEEKLSKDEILEIYLNQIFFGNTAYGIKAAAKCYFHKELSELTVAEGALLAGLPKAPSKYSPLLNMKGAKVRQRYVIGQMVKTGFITQQIADQALNEDVRVYPATQQNIYAAPYFVSEVRREFAEKWKDYDLESEGLEIHTTLDLTANRLAQRSLRDGLRIVDKRRGWRGPIGKVKGGVDQFRKDYASTFSDPVEIAEVYPALVTEIQRAKGVVKVAFGGYTATVDIRGAGWAKKKLDRDDHTSFIKPEDSLQEGDVIEVSVRAPEAEKGQELPVPTPLPVSGDLHNVKLDQTPAIEGALVLIDPNSGRVATMIGGYSFQRSVFNRATQSLRQPGSTFKPIVYLSAVDGFKYTPATIVHDSPKSLRVGDVIWSPGNYDEKYLGPITLRTALERSRNLVSVDIVSRIGVVPVIRYAKKLGITNPIGRHPSIALGSSEVTLLELSRAYGVFAAKGVLFNTYYVNKITDRTGATIYDRSSESFTSAQQAISEASAFVMANMMKGVIQSGTATVIKPINRPVAGKTGTTNNMMDAWFIGYTPEWVCGIWTGFDVKKKIGEKETGGKVAAPIWLNVMQPFLDHQDAVNYEKLVEDTKAEAARLGIQYVAPEKLQPLDFAVPEGVEGFWVNKSSGVPTEANQPGSIFEYFLKGTAPTEVSIPEEETSTYLDSPDL